MSLGWRRRGGVATGDAKTQRRKRGRAGGGSGCGEPLAGLHVDEPAGICGAVVPEPRFAVGAPEVRIDGAGGPEPGEGIGIEPDGVGHGVGRQVEKAVLGVPNPAVEFHGDIVAEPGKAPPSAADGGEGAVPGTVDLEVVEIKLGVGIVAEGEHVEVGAVDGEAAEAFRGERFDLELGLPWAVGHGVVHGDVAVGSVEVDGGVWGIVPGTVEDAEDVDEELPAHSGSVPWGRLAGDGAGDDLLVPGRTLAAGEEKGSAGVVGAAVFGVFIHGDGGLAGGVEHDGRPEFEFPEGFGVVDDFGVPVGSAEGEGIVEIVEGGALEGSGIVAVDDVEGAILGFQGETGQAVLDGAGGGKREACPGIVAGGEPEIETGAVFADEDGGAGRIQLHGRVPAAGSDDVLGGRDAVGDGLVDEAGGGVGLVLDVGDVDDVGGFVDSQGGGD